MELSDVEDTPSFLGTELETLESIYINEIKVDKSEEGFTIVSIDLHPATGDDVNKQYVRLTLIFRLSDQYPADVPEIHVQNPRGLSEEMVASIMIKTKMIAEDKKDHAMLFEIIEAVKELLTAENRPCGTCCICLYGFSDTDVYTKTDCYHYFHSHCLARHLSSSSVVQKEDNEDESIASSDEIKFPCPVCRIPVAFEGSVDQYPPPSAADEDVPMCGAIAEMSRTMALLYEKQLKQGGIIDVEAEKNKFLIEISNMPTVTKPPASAVAKTENAAVKSGPTKDKSSDVDNELENDPPPSSVAAASHNEEVNVNHRNRRSYGTDRRYSNRYRQARQFYDVRRTPRKSAGEVDKDSRSPRKEKFDNRDSDKQDNQTDVAQDAKGSCELPVHKRQDGSNPRRNNRPRPPRYNRQDRSYPFKENRRNDSYKNINHRRRGDEMHNGDDRNVLEVKDENGCEAGVLNEETVDEKDELQAASVENTSEVEEGCSVIPYRKNKRTNRNRKENNKADPENDEVKSAVEKDENVHHSTNSNNARYRESYQYQRRDNKFYQNGGSTRGNYYRNDRYRNDNYYHCDRDRNTNSNQSSNRYKQGNSYHGDNHRGGYSYHDEMPRSDRSYQNGGHKEGYSDHSNHQRNSSDRDRGFRSYQSNRHSNGKVRHRTDSRNYSENDTCDKEILKNDLPPSSSNEYEDKQRNESQNVNMERARSSKSERVRRENFPPKNIGSPKNFHAKVAKPQNTNAQRNLRDAQNHKFTESQQDPEASDLERKGRSNSQGYIDIRDQYDMEDRDSKKGARQRHPKPKRPNRNRNRQDSKCSEDSIKTDLLPTPTEANTTVAQSVSKLTCQLSETGSASGNIGELFPEKKMPPPPPGYNNPARRLVNSKDILKQRHPKPKHPKSNRNRQDSKCSEDSKNTDLIPTLTEANNTVAQSVSKPTCRSSETGSASGDIGALFPEKKMMPPPPGFNNPARRLVYGLAAANPPPGFQRS